MSPILGVNQAGLETEQKATELTFTLVFFFLSPPASAQLKEVRGKINK